MPDADDYDANTYDQYIGAEVLLPQGDKMMTGRVTERKRSRDGEVKGKGHTNPMLDT